MKLISCGRIGRPHGVRGAVSVYWNNADSPIAAGDELYLASGEGSLSYQVVTFERHAKHDVLMLRGVHSRDAASLLTGKEVLLPEARLQRLPSGEYYSFQLVGLSVVTEGGKSLGTIRHIFSTGANDVYEVWDGTTEILIPAIDHVVLSVEIEKQRIVVRSLEEWMEREENAI
ncbi:MAG: 16S rRNA processing protein RimM [Deltaproteobacteria bacterium]|nr:16S rRNA processing protein RimM [Deltaproteobacteria bacterium]